MSTIPQFHQANLSEEEIDRQVEVQANDDSAWEESIQVHQQSLSISLSPELAAQAKFLARKEGIVNVEIWVIELLKEQITHKLKAFTHGN